MTKSTRLLYETHAHTPLCKHAVGRPEDYAEVARERGLRGVVITCHNPMPDGFSSNVRMGVDQLEQYVELVKRARECYAGRADIRLGLECDYFPGYERWLERQLDSAEFEYVLGSIHPQVREYRARFWTGEALEFQRSYFDQLAAAAETGLFDCIAHPDIVKNEIPDHWDPLAIMDDVRRALDRIAASGVALELNTSGAKKIVPEMNPFPAMLAEMSARSIPAVVGSDAHEPERVGDRFGEALDWLSKCGYECVSFFLQRRRHDVPLAAAKQSLKEEVRGERRAGTMPTG